MQYFILFIVVLLLCLIYFLPLGIVAEYTKGNASAKLLIGPFSRSLYPKSRKQTMNKKTMSTGKFESHEQVKSETIGNIFDYFPILRTIFDLIFDFKRKCRVDELRINLLFAGDDPCDLSIQFGYTCASLGNLLSLFESQFFVKNRNIRVQCDYTAERSAVDFGIHLTISLGNLLLSCVYHGSRVLREYFKLSKNAKDGAML